MTILPLNIVADENIPYVQDAFETVGRVKLVPGRTIRPSTLIDAHILLVRSVTKVNRQLLENASIQFVGTATAGLDHVDVEYLESKNIAFASAQGGNANSVAEYVIAALLGISERQGLTLAGKTIGIVGAGNIGQLVESKAESLGMTVVLNDPPLAQKTAHPKYRPLEETLACDIVTLHVPLTFEGRFKTFHLFDHDLLSHLKPTTIFINTSRGEVVDNGALLKRLQQKTLGATVLDVWESEPEINWDLFKLVCLGTPHIAGYSLDGKAQGTFRLYHALCQHLDLPESWRPSHSLPLPTLPRVDLEGKNRTHEQILAGLISKIYDLQADHRRMAQLLKFPPEKRPVEFDRLRKSYPIRREFYHTQVNCRNLGIRFQRHIMGLGFKCEVGGSLPSVPE